MTEGRGLLAGALGLFEAYVQEAACWAVYLSVSTPELILEELWKAAPLLTQDEVFRLDLHERIVLTFQNEGQARELFECVVGDDGPTKSNPYEGRARIYACLGGPDGLCTENT